MEVILTEEMFVNNKYTVSYGDRSAVFTIIDEEFSGFNKLGRINRITVVVTRYGVDGNNAEASLHTTVIGLGDGVVGVHSDVPELRGKLLNRDNMSRCVVELYEDG